MNKVTKLIVSVLAVSLILVTGCYDTEGPDQDVTGYDGLVAAGWECFQAGDYEMAMTNFQNAIDMDVSRPEAFLGAGWTSIFRTDYWVLGDQYDYMAVQLDDGSWPVETVSTSIEQDMLWTVFQCVDPVLTANDMQVIASFGDTILVVEGDTIFWGGETGPDAEKQFIDNQEIGQWLYDQYGAEPFKYTFEIADPNVTALFYFTNGFTQLNCNVDSIVNGASSSTVYLNVPYKRQAVGDEDYRTWCMYENVMTYEYATYDDASGSTDIANDAVAAYGILQHARGVNGDGLAGVASLVGLADEAEYSFQYFSGLSSLKLKGMAAAIAYANTDFRFAFFICRTEGYAMDIAIDDPDFLVELMQEIEMMLI